MNVGAFAAFALLLAAGCLGAGPEPVAGKYAYINWGKSSKSCQNDVCTYGQNSEELEARVTCGEKTRLSWDLQNWIHGAMRVTVYDATDQQKHQRTLNRDGRGNVSLEGPAGQWLLQGQTTNANGNLQVRLTCL